MTTNITRKPSRTLLMFAVLCLCWGSTFIPLKEGLGTLPPLFFAGGRFVLAASVFSLLLGLRSGIPRGLSRADWGRLVGSSLLVITATYGLLFWGAQFLPSGTSSLVSFGSGALALTGLSLLLNLERATLAKGLSVAIGLLGLSLLVAPQLGTDAPYALGVLAISLSGLCYGWGSLHIRPLIRQHGALFVTTCQTAIGGLTLLGLSWGLEQPGSATLAALREPTTLLSLLYLVIVGSLIGFWLYNHLLALWDASRLALYNFLCPLIALALGGIIYGESLRGLEALAALCLLLAVWVNRAGRLREEKLEQEQL